MRKEEIQNRVQGIVIKNPCTVDWNDMEGDQCVRFCQQCNLNVHNISSMSDKEVVELLDDKKDSRTCMYMYRRQDGSIVTDNCPAALRATRKKIRAIAMAAFVTLTWSLALSAMAQGLVGAPVDPRYGQGAEVGQMQDFGYDTAKNIADAITYITVLITIFIPLSRYKKAKLKQRILQHTWIGVDPNPCANGRNGCNQQLWRTRRRFLAQCRR